MWDPLHLIATAVLVAATQGMAVPGSETADPPREISALQMVWQVERNAGSASGTRSCAVISRGGDVVARLGDLRQGPPPAWSVVVGFDNEPGSLRYLRINDSYFTSDKPSFHGSEADAIVALLKGPGVFAFEWARRPDYAKRQGLFGTGDFAAKAAACEDWMKGRRA